MADHHQRPLMRLHQLFQPFNGRQIQMVCGLIQQQHIWLTYQRTGQRGTSGLTTGQPVCHPVWFHPHLHQHRFGTVNLAGIIKPLHHIRGQRLRAFDFRGLWQIGNLCAGADPQAAFIWFRITRDKLHQGGFPRAIASDQRQPVTSMQGQIHMPQQPAIAKIHAHIRKCQKRGRHYLFLYRAI